MQHSAVSRRENIGREHNIVGIIIFTHLSNKYRRIGTIWDADYQVSSWNLHFTSTTEEGASSKIVSCIQGMSRVQS